MPKYSVTVTRTTTRETQVEVDSTSPAAAQADAMNLVQKLIDGEEPGKTVDALEWELIEDTADVENEPEEL